MTSHNKQTNNGSHEESATNLRDVWKSWPLKCKKSGMDTKNHLESGLRSILIDLSALCTPATPGIAASASSWMTPWRYGERNYKKETHWNHQGNPTKNRGVIHSDSLWDTSWDTILMCPTLEIYDFPGLSVIATVWERHSTTVARGPMRQGERCQRFFFAHTAGRGLFDKQPLSTSFTKDLANGCQTVGKKV